MSIFVAEDQVTEQLDAGLAGLSGPLLFHLDILKVGIIGGMKPRDRIVADHRRVLDTVLGDREHLIPTFNYDFCGDGRYDRQHSPSQIGVLNDHYRTEFPGSRTRTPVFNFVVRNNRSFSMAEVTNPFSAESTFAGLAEQRGYVVFLGTGLDSNTFLHHVEEMAGIGYRYLKAFTGEIHDGGERTPITLDYRVRPRLPFAAEYDFERLGAELTEQGLLSTFQLGNSTASVYPTAELLGFWRERIAADEFYLLTRRSRELAEDLYRTHGEPLSWEAVEGDSGG